MADRWAALAPPLAMETGFFYAAEVQTVLLGAHLPVDDRPVVPWWGATAAVDGGHAAAQSGVGAGAFVLTL